MLYDTALSVCHSVRFQLTHFRTKFLLFRLLDNLGHSDAEEDH